MGAEALDAMYRRLQQALDSLGPVPGNNLAQQQRLARALDALVEEDLVAAVRPEKRLRPKQLRRLVS